MKERLDLSFWSYTDIAQPRQQQLNTNHFKQWAEGSISLDSCEITYDLVN